MPQVVGVTDEAKIVTVCGEESMVYAGGTITYGINFYKFLMFPYIVSRIHLKFNTNLSFFCHKRSLVKKAAVISISIKLVMMLV